MNNIIDSVTGFTGEQIKVVDANYDNSRMDQEDFLKVLLANFKYQDPFDAQDISKFIEDTLGLRQLEVMNNFENAVNSLVSGGSSTLLLQASNLIDEKVIYEGNTTYIENGKSQIEFKLAENADIVTIYIYDENSEVVKSETFFDLNLGKLYPYTIDDPSIENGYYSVSVVAKKDDKSIDSTIYSTALVKGIERKDNDIVALFEHGEINLDMIKQIGG